MDIWKKAILKTLDACYGEARYEVICNKINKFIALTESDEEEVSPGVFAYWEQVRHHLSQLVEFGDVSERGQNLYVLTEQGERRVKEENFEWIYTIDL